MQRFTEADMVWADSSITVLSLAAMWMTARKLIENWMVWLAVDVLATTVYLKKGINLYALLYFVYTGMAIAGWIAWKKDLHPTNN
jgi:nicotinamide mononucleotide transporter